MVGGWPRTHTVVAGSRIGTQEAIPPVSVSAVEDSGGWTSRPASLLITPDHLIAILIAILALILLPPSWSSLG